MQIKHKLKQTGKNNSRIVFLLLMSLSLCGCAGKPDLRMDGFCAEESETGLPEGTASPQDGAAQLSKKEASPGEDTAETEKAILVFVCGAVENAGVYSLKAGSRLYEAVEAAGGFRADADRDWLNLADTLQDGQKLRVYTMEETAALWKQEGQAQGVNAEDSGGASDHSGTGASDSSGKVNLNTATREQLMTLPGIGGAKADAVIAYREEYGGFQAIEDIMKIRGIKEAVFSKIKDKIIV